MMDENLIYCQTCLSKQRRLCPITKLQHLLEDVGVWQLGAVGGGMCWECRSVIVKFSRFKEQVNHAQALLIHSREFKDLKSLSKLSVKTNDNQYHYLYTCDPLTNPETKNPELKIKQELEIENYSKDTNICNKKCFETEKSVNDKNCFNDFDEIHAIEEKLTEIDEDLNESVDDCEEKPSTIEASDIYVEILNADVKKERRHNYKKDEYKKTITRYRSRKKNRDTDTDGEEEVKEKFITVEFTEEEMIRNREDKRNQPNFKKIPYKCNSCVLGFTRKDTYDMHMGKKHDEKVGDHPCPVCAMRFTDRKQVERHKRKHYVCYRCRLCKYETLNLWSAFSHCRLKHHGDTWESIHCPYCDNVAKSPEELAQHVTAEHSLHCKECGEKFKGPNTLRKHKRRIHAVKREFVCDMCSKAFNTKSRLESHMVTHNAALAQKLAYCAACDVQYKNIYVYRNHLKTSANHAQQTYECRECNKCFASKVYWKKHHNFYHLHKSQFNCDICNKLFISHWRLNNHRQTQHGLSRSRDHHCNVCGKQFFTLSTLKGHQLTHSDQRSFMCEDCGDTFKQRPALYTHYKLVHKGLKRRRKP